MTAKVEEHSPAPVKHSMSGRGVCKVCGRPVESKTLRGIYRHESMRTVGEDEER